MRRHHAVTTASDGRVRDGLADGDMPDCPFFQGLINNKSNERTNASLTLLMPQRIDGMQDRGLESGNHTEQDTRPG